MHHRFRFSTSGKPTKHMPIGYLSLRVQPRSVTSGDLNWPWNLSGEMSRVTSSHVFTPISSTIPITVNRTTPSCVYSRFRWNLVEGCSSYDVITSWPDLTRTNLFHQKLRKRFPISYEKFQRDSPNAVASSSEKLMGGLHQPPWPGEGSLFLAGRLQKSHSGFFYLIAKRLEPSSWNFRTLLTYSLRIFWQKNIPGQDRSGHQRRDPSSRVLLLKCEVVRKPKYYFEHFQTFRVL